MAGGDELRRVLLVEDEADIRMIATLALEEVGGFEVDSVDDGAQAVAKALQSQPDLILLDVMMPGLDGPATLEALGREPGTASIPVVFLTAKVQPQEAEYLFGLGALGVLAKPFDPMTLSEELRAIWSSRQR